MNFLVLVPDRGVVPVLIESNLTIGKNYYNCKIMSNHCTVIMTDC